MDTIRKYVKDVIIISTALENSLIGKKFNSLTIIGIDHDKYEKDLIRVQNKEIKSVSLYFICKCDCGKEKSINKSHVVSGKTKTCGHKRDFEISTKFKESIGEFICKTYGEEWIEHHWVDDTYNPFQIGSGVDSVRVKIRCCQGHTFNVSPKRLKKSTSCPYCTGRKILKGFNDLSTTHPDLVKFIVNKDDSTKYSYGSSTKIQMICPYCNEERLYPINKLCRFRTLPCKCGDGFSYPNKFVYNFLSQLNIEYISEKVFEWAKDKRYDVYIPSLKILIENHGGQHYEKYNGIYKHSITEIQINDRLKEDLAFVNGVEHYIKLDCRVSESQFIKDSIMNSKLPKLLNFNESDIDWTECEKYALGNILSVVCELWDERTNHKDTISETGLSKATIIRYLKSGAELGMCGYDAKREMARNYENVKKRVMASSNKVEVFKNGESLGVFKSGKYLSRVSDRIFGTKFKYPNIIAVCTGRRKHHKGYQFKYCPQCQSSYEFELDNKGNKIIIKGE